MNKVVPALALLGLINIGLYLTNTADFLSPYKRGVEKAQEVCSLFFTDCYDLT